MVNQGKLNCTAEVNKGTRRKYKIIFRNASEDKSRGNTIRVVVDHGQNTKRGSKHSEGNVLMEESVPLNSRKRRPEMLDVVPSAKKQKMDCSLKLRLRKILKELINHPVGLIFSEPVDPVKLNIPDYFSVITKPMDLGTILRKLEGNIYTGADEVSADVRLTFSNAMLYNPPWHEVHCLAKKFDAMFSRKLKLLEENLKHANKDDGEARLIDFMGNNGQATKNIVENNHQNMEPIGLNKTPLPIKHGTRLMSLEEKQKFRLELVKCRQMIEQLRTVFKKFGLAGLNEEKLDSYIDSADDETLWNLREEVKAVLSAKHGKAQPGKVGLKSCFSLNKAVEKVSPKHGLSIDITESGSTCVSLKRNRLRTGAPKGSASDRSSERSEELSHCADSKLENNVKYPSESRTSGCVSDSDGPVVVNEADNFHLSTPASFEGCCPIIAPLSPQKALRAAMLKCRFAETIFKATHQELLERESSDPLRMQKERERLEREQQKEKEKIEAQIKAAEAASRRREQDGLRMRERERNAARIALEKLEKSVELDNNVGVLEDLKMFGCGYLYDPREAIHHGNFLHQLGLECRVDFLEDDDDGDQPLNIEDGEIIS
ncbi:hypothetical protein ACS0TY_031544 [Phlomoides rotata]